MRGFESAPAYETCRSSSFMVCLDSIPTLSPVARVCTDLSRPPEPPPRRNFFEGDFRLSRRMFVCVQVRSSHGETPHECAKYLGRGGAYFSGD